MKKLLPAFLLTLLLFAAPSGYATTFKIATLSPEGSGWMKQFRAAAEKVEEKTDGRVKFKFYPGGVMGSDKSVLKKMRFGQLHGGAMTTGAIASVYPDMTIYNVPFLFRSQEEVDKVRARLDDEVFSGLKDKGLTLLGYAGGGFAYILSNQPVHTPNDLASQKVWAPVGDNVTIKTLQSLNATPVPLNLGDVLTALQTGMVETVATSPVSALALQWHTAVRYRTQLPIVYVSAALAVNSKHFNKLSAGDQKIVKDAFATALASIDAENREDNIEAAAALAHQGVQPVSLTSQQQSAWQDISRKVMNTSLEKYNFSDDMVNKLQKALRDVRADDQGTSG